MCCGCLPSPKLGTRWREQQAFLVPNASHALLLSQISDVAPKLERAGLARLLLLQEGSIRGGEAAGEEAEDRGTRLSPDTSIESERGKQQTLPPPAAAGKSSSHSCPGTSTQTGVQGALWPGSLLGLWQHP